MLAAILFAFGFGAEVDTIDAIVKARIELARKPKVVQLDPTYTISRERAIKENKVLLVLVNSEVKQCTETGCRPIPANWILYRVKTFDLGKETVSKGIIVSSPKDGELWFLKTLPDQSTIDDVENLVNPVVTVKRWVPCPTCPGGRRYID